MIRIGVNWLHLHNPSPRLSKANLIKWWVSRNKLETITFTNICNYLPWVYFSMHAQRWHIYGAFMEHIYIMGPWGQNTSHRLSYRPEAQNNTAAMLEMHCKWPCTTSEWSKSKRLIFVSEKYCINAHSLFMKHFIWKKGQTCDLFDVSIACLWKQD